MNIQTIIKYQKTIVHDVDDYANGRRDQHDERVYGVVWVDDPLHTQVNKHAGQYP